MMENKLYVFLVICALMLTFYNFNSTIANSYSRPKTSLIYGKQEIFFNGLTFKINISFIFYVSKKDMNRRMHALNGNIMTVEIRGIIYHFEAGKKVDPKYRKVDLHLHGRDNSSYNEGVLFGSFDMTYDNWWKAIGEIKFFHKNIRLSSHITPDRVFFDKMDLIFTQSKPDNHRSNENTNVLSVLDVRNFDKVHDIEVSQKLELYYFFENILGTEITNSIFEMDLGLWNFCTKSGPKILDNWSFETNADDNFWYNGGEYKVIEHEEGVVDLIFKRKTIRYEFDFCLPIVAEGHVFESYFEILSKSNNDFVNKKGDLDTLDKGVEKIYISHKPSGPKLTCGLQYLPVRQTLINSTKFHLNVRRIYNTETGIPRGVRLYMAAFLEVAQINMHFDKVISDFLNGSIKFIRVKGARRHIMSNFAQILNQPDTYNGSHDKDIINQIKLFVSKEIHLTNFLDPVIIKKPIRSYPKNERPLEFKLIQIWDKNEIIVFEVDVINELYKKYIGGKKIDKKIVEFCEFFSEMVPNVKIDYGLEPPRTKEDFDMCEEVILDTLNQIGAMMIGYMNYKDFYDQNGIWIEKFIKGSMYITDLTDRLEPKKSEYLKFWVKKKITAKKMKIIVSTPQSLLNQCLYILPKNAKMPTISEIERRLKDTAIMERLKERACHEKAVKIVSSYLRKV